MKIYENGQPFSMNFISNKFFILKMKDETFTSGSLKGFRNKSL